jgi:hypothetical protein
MTGAVVTCKFTDETRTAGKPFSSATVTSTYTAAASFPGCSPNGDEELGLLPRPCAIVRGLLRQSTAAATGLGVPKAQRQTVLVGQNQYLALFSDHETPLCANYWSRLRGPICMYRNVCAVETTSTPQRHDTLRNRCIFPLNICLV